MTYTSHVRALAPYLNVAAMPISEYLEKNYAKQPVAYLDVAFII